MTLNTQTIIFYLEERSLCKRSIYFVINVAVADMPVAGCVVIAFSCLGRILLMPERGTGNGQRATGNGQRATSVQR